MIRERYTKAFNEKETLMLGGMKKGKRIEELEAQVGFVLDSYKTYGEYRENHAPDFIMGFGIGRSN